MNIRTQSLVEAAAVFLGLWILVAKVPDSLIFMFMQILGSEQFEAVHIWLNVVRLLIYLAIGLALLLGRKWLARYIDPVDAESTFETQKVVSAAIALLGLYFLAQGAVVLGEALVVQFQENYSAVSLYGRGATSVGAGFLLFICSGGLSKAWALLMRLRTAGV